MNRRFLVPAAVAGLLASGAAMAQVDEWHSPWQQKFWGYIGAGAGESKFRDTCGNIFDCDRKDSAWNLHLGGNFSRILGMELGYTDYGTMSAFGGNTEANATSISLTAGVPIGDRFAIFAKGGAAYGRTDVSAAPSAGVRTGSNNDWGGTYGAGATFAITHNVLARVDWDRTKLSFTSGDRDVDMVSAGLQLRF